MSNSNSTNTRRGVGMTREQAKAYHPSAYRPKPDLRVVPPLETVFTPQDSIATAQAFAAELANAERGIAVTSPKVPSKSRLFSVSRERKARWMDRIAVTLLMLLMAALGCIVLLASAPHAKADGGGYDPVAYAYAATYATAVCETLGGGHATTNGMLGIMRAIQKDGLTAAQAGEAVGISIYETCPRYVYLIDLFVARYGSSKASVA